MEFKNRQLLGRKEEYRQHHSQLRQKATGKTSSWVRKLYSCCIQEKQTSCLFTDNICDCTKENTYLVWKKLVWVWGEGYQELEYQIITVLNKSSSVFLMSKLWINQVLFCFAFISQGASFHTSGFAVPQNWHTVPAISCRPQAHKSKYITCCSG